jgi:hypothetical protein
MSCYCGMRRWLVWTLTCCPGGSSPTSPSTTQRCAGARAGWVCCQLGLVGLDLSLHVQRGTCWACKLETATTASLARCCRAPASAERFAVPPCVPMLTGLLLDPCLPSAVLRCPVLSCTMPCCAVLQGFCASLELLPMGANVDPDCELFASGIVKDDEDDWGVGAHPLAVKQAVAPTKVGAGVRLIFNPVELWVWHALLTYPTCCQAGSCASQGGRGDVDAIS